jgi:hypothetical protein
MSFAKAFLAMFLIAATGATCVVFLHAREREAQSRRLEQAVVELQQHRQTLAARVEADVTSERATGLYQVQEHAMPGFRPMEFMAAPTKERALTLYVSLVPDLVLEDIAGAHWEDRGLGVQLTPAGQARLRALSRARTAGGRVAREAIVLDGRVVAVPVLRGEIQSDTFVVGDTAEVSSSWTQKLLAEINATQKR